MKTALWDKILPDWQKSLKKWPQNAFSKWFGKSEKTNVKVQLIRKYKNTPHVWITPHAVFIL